jgi:hypothetical protein
MFSALRIEQTLVGFFAPPFPLSHKILLDESENMRKISACIHRFLTRFNSRFSLSMRSTLKDIPDLLDDLKSSINILSAFVMALPENKLNRRRVTVHRIAKSDVLQTT